MTVASSSPSSSSSDSVSSPSLADLINYLSYLAHKGHRALPSIDDLIKRARVLTKAGKSEQMEVLSLVAVSVSVAAVIGFFLWKMWNKDEDTFAKARANKQITLLDDIAAPKKNTDNKKEKEKQQKKKEEKKKKAAASADSKEDKDVPAAAVAAPVAAAAKLESPKPAPAAPASAKKEQPKPEEPKKKETAVVAEPVAVKKEEAAPLQTAPVPEQKKPAQANGDKKANKKSSANKQVEEIENEEEFVEAKTKKNKKTEKKDVAPATSAASETTAPRHLSLKDLDTNKVVARLSSIDEIEVEYIEYLNNFFRSTADNVAGAAKETAIAKIRAEDSSRALEKVKGDLKKLEGELEGNRRLTHELATKAAAAGSMEQELKSKMAAIEAEKEKFRREAEVAKKAAASAAAAAAAIVIPVVPDNKEELEKLKTDAKSAAARIADLEEQLKNTKDNAAKERKQLEQSVLLQKTHEDTALGQEVLLAESRQNAKAIGERLTGLEQERKSMEQRLDEANKQCDELKEQSNQREATHAADTLSLKTMIEELNKEVHRFEEAKREQTEMVAKLAAKEAELIKKCAALEDAEKQISAIKKGSESSSSASEAQIATLTKRVSELEASLEEEKKRAAEIVVPVAEPKKEVDIEEVVQLQKSAYLDAAPPAASADAEKVAELEKEVARLQEKNTELRTMNHSMVDQMNVLEKRFMANGVAAPSASAPTPAAAGEKGGKKGKKGGEKKEEQKEKEAAPVPKEEKKADEAELVRAERRLMQAHIGKLIGSPLDEDADTKAYEKWLKAAGASIKEAQEKAKKTAAAPAPVPVQAAPAPASDEETEHLRTENNTLRDALFLVTEELHTIEQLKTNREEDYVRRISELEKKHGKAQIAEVRSAMDALPALTVPAAGANVATETRPAAPARTSPPTSQSEDDGSWEVVA